MIKLSFFFILSLSIFPRPAQSFPQNKNNLVVSFISVGTGIDYKAKEKLQLLIEDFQREHDVNLEISIKNWGKEGETDYTCHLNRLSRKERRLFIEQVREMFAGNKRVIILAIPRSQ
jgi:hypothetical protein